jgi:hypothetical protein
MFFYRYGRVNGFQEGTSRSAETNLMQVDAVQCRDGGLVELSQVFKKDQCVEVFKVCWQRLKTVLQTEARTHSSLIRWIVHANRLSERRTASIRTTSPQGVLPPPVFGLRTRSPPAVVLRTSSLPVVASQPLGLPVFPPQPLGLPVFPPRTLSPPIVASRTKSQGGGPPLSRKKEKKEKRMRSPAPPTVASRTRSSDSPPSSKRKKVQKPKKGHGAKEEEYSTNSSMTNRTRSHPSEPSENSTVATRTRSHSLDEADHFSTTGDGTKISDGGKKLSRTNRRMAKKEKRKQKKKNRYSS